MVWYLIYALIVILYLAIICDLIVFFSNYGKYVQGIDPTYTFVSTDFRSVFSFGALWSVTCIAFVNSVRIVFIEIFNYEYIPTDFMFIEHDFLRQAMENFDIFFELLTAPDLISSFLIVLTHLVMILCYWYIFMLRPKKWFQLLGHLFLIHCFLLAAFVVSDALLFYIFFESILIPMFMIIGCWGSRDRRIKANYFFFLYTLFGSLFMLFGLMYLYMCFKSLRYEIFTHQKLPGFLQCMLWFCFFLPFAIKTPMVPFHIWLPEAHVEAPTVGSVILAGLLLKLGGYGFIRFTLPLFKYANYYYSCIIYGTALMGVVYASLITIRQIDLKRIVAYSSVAHMNLVVVGLFSYTLQGLEGSFYLMMAHGFVSSAFFFLIGMLYSRTHSRLINYYGGFSVLMPKFSFFFFNFSLANMAFPGTSNFVGEFLIVVGLADKNTLVLIIATLSVIFSAVYSIWLFNRVCFGTFKPQYFNASLLWKFALDKIELFILGILLLFTWLTGVTSDFILIPTFHLNIIDILQLCLLNLTV